MGVLHHFNSEFRVHGMNGNVYRRKTHFDDAVDIFLLKICKGYIVSEKESETGVIVFKIKGLSHSRRHLVDEAENAFVFAGMFLIHKIVFKIKTEIFIFLLFDGYCSGCAVFQKLDFKLFIGHIKAVVKNVFDLVSVYGN